MKITRSAFAKAVAKQLAPGKRINSAEVQKTLQQMGVDPRFKGEVKEYQLKDAFETLKEKGLLKATAAATGQHVFTDSVKKEAHHEANPGLSKEQQLAHNKSLLRERMDEEAAKKQRITEALQGGKGSAGHTKVSGEKSGSVPPAMAKAPIGSAVVQSRRPNDASVRPAGPAAAWEGPSQGEEQAVPHARAVPPVQQDQRTQEPPDMFGPEE